MIEPASEVVESGSLENYSGVDPRELGEYLDYLILRLDRHRDGRKPVVYFAPSIEWFGQACHDSHIIKTLYDTKSHQVFFASHKPRLGINPNVSSIAVRDFVPTFIEDHLTEWHVALSTANMKSGLTVSRRGYTFLFGGHATALRERYHHHLLANGRAATFWLTPEEIELRASILRGCGVEAGDKIAVIHARSSGYWASRYASGTDPTNEFRNARIENYVPAIEHLQRNGYFVVRVGDSKMPPAPVTGSRFLDAPHSPDYQPFIDVAFTSCCDVFIHCCSGPLDLARGFGRPLLGINTYFSSHWPTEPDDVFLPKRYRLTHNGDDLSIPEIFNLDLCGISMVSHLAEVGVEVVENTPDEILAMVEASLGPDGEETIRSSPAAVGFRAIAKAEHEMRTARHDPAPARRSFVMWHPRIAMSAVALESNPSLLSGELLPLDQRPWSLG